jgi:hypothetical protein
MGGDHYNQKKTKKKKKKCAFFDSIYDLTKKFDRNPPVRYITLTTDLESSKLFFSINEGMKLLRLELDPITDSLQTTPSVSDG